MIRKLKPASRSAEFKPGTVDEKKRTVELVWSTGARVLRGGWFTDPFYEELSMEGKAIRLDRLNGGAPFLDTHNDYRLQDVIGVVEKAWVEGGEGRAIVRFSNRDEVEPIWRDIVDGILRNISVGYRIHKLESTGFDPDTGYEIMRATDWEPFELSAVPIPADAGAGFRSESVTENPCEVQSQKPAADEPEAQTEGESEMPKPTPGTAVTQDPVTDNTEAARKEAAQAERARVQEIIDIARAAKLPADESEKFIKDGTSPDEVRKAVIARMATKDPITPSIVVTDTQEMGRKEGMEEAILHRVNPGAHKITEKSRQFVGMNLLRMAEEAVGAKARGMTRSQLAIRAMGTSDFPEILANVAAKSLRNAYTIQPRTFLPFVKIGTLSDYKSSKRVQLGAAPSLDDMSEGEEYQYGSIGEAAESIQLVKRGKKIRITEETIINDDLDALSRIPALFGASAARKESAEVYAILTGNPTMADGVALFHASHGNLPTAAAITVASLGAAKADMRAQMDIDSADYLDLEPAFLICGPDKETEARQILFGNQVADAVTNTNIFRNTMGLVVDSRISGNKWFLAASPSLIDTIELAYLEGMNGPEITSSFDENNDCITIKCKHVFKAKALDHRGLLYNSGL